MNELSDNVFEAHRPFLTSLAARIMGNWSEAQDLVNEAFLRWHKLDHDEVANPKALLATIVSRLAINYRTSARSRREMTVEPRTMAEIMPAASEEPEDMADALGDAFEIVLSRLAPTERAVFLLREVFQFDYRDLAELLDETEANCRQILKRARGKISAPEPRFEVPAEKRELALERFLSLSHTGSLEEFMAVVAPEVVLVRDPQDIGLPQPPVLLGPSALLGHLQRFWQKFPGSTWSVCPIGQGYQVATIQSAQRKIIGAFICTAREGVINQVNHVSCPTRLSVFLHLISTGH
jgi:RNA polymerase sigma factor (sigma-70 family)